MSEQKEEEFWLSDKGILIRLEDLSHNFVFKVFNGAVRGYAKDAGFKEFRWVAVIDQKTCNYCDSQNGRSYKSGQFLPKMPKHIGCRCFWDILMEV